jgi:hypothetical protein
MQDHHGIHAQKIVVVLLLVPLFAQAAPFQIQGLQRTSSACCPSPSWVYWPQRGWSMILTVGGDACEERCREGEKKKSKEKNEVVVVVIVEGKP